MKWGRKVGLTREQYEAAIKESQAQYNTEVQQANSSHLSRIEELDAQWRESDHNKG